MTITITATDSPLTERIIKYLRREKVQFAVQSDDNADVPPTKAEFLDDFRDSLLWAKQHGAGKIENEQSFDDFLNELENELEPQKILV